VGLKEEINVYVIKEYKGSSKISDWTASQLFKRHPFLKKIN
jgi:hypothetical protein